MNNLYDFSSASMFFPHIFLPPLTISLVALRLFDINADAAVNSGHSRSGSLMDIEQVSNIRGQSSDLLIEPLPASSIKCPKFIQVHLSTVRKQRCSAHRHGMCVFVPRSLVLSGPSTSHRDASGCSSYMRGAALNLSSLVTRKRPLFSLAKSHCAG